MVKIYFILSIILVSQYDLLKNEIKNNLAKFYKIDNNEFKNSESYQASISDYIDKSKIKEIKFIRINHRKFYSRYSTITYYNFVDIVSANSFITNVTKASQQNESILSKDFDCLLLSKNIVLRVDGSCSFSKNDWITYLISVEKAFQKVTSDGKKKLECICGGKIITY